MKKFSVIAVTVAVLAMLVTSTTVFADQSGNNQSPGRSGNPFGNKLANVDPVKRLQDEKANIQKRLADSKITQDQADKAIAKIDEQIKKLQDFNNLTLDQKKAKLVEDFTAAVNNQVQAGKLAQDKADKMIADYKARVDKWDGTGYPFFGRFGMALKGLTDGMPEGKMRDGKVPGGNVDPVKRLQDEKANIQKRLADSKITQDQADKAIAKIDEQIKKLQDFNNLTLDQKKAKLVEDFTAAVNNQVQAGKLTQDKADKMIADYKARVDKWDGTGYPFFGRFGMAPKGLTGGMPEGKGFKSHLQGAADGSVNQQL